MSDLLIHGHTQRLVDGYVESPAQAILLTGPKGVGKGSLAHHLAEHEVPVGDRFALSILTIGCLRVGDGRLQPVNMLAQLAHHQEAAVFEQSGHCRRIVRGYLVGRIGVSTEHLSGVNDVVPVDGAPVFFFIGGL